MLRRGRYVKRRVLSPKAGKRAGQREIHGWRQTADRQAGKSARLRLEAMSWLRQGMKQLAAHSEMS